jgi:hypothetical protein
MFFFCGKNSAYIDYWQILLIAIIFAIGGIALYLIVVHVGKSPQAAAVVSIVLWILFFTIRRVTDKIMLILAVLNMAFRYSMILVLLIMLLLIAFHFSRRLRKKEPFVIIAVFEIVLFLLNFVPATISEIIKYFSHSDFGYTNNFKVDTNSPSPNIYWLFMDGMLGFKAMEDIFNDPQVEFESKLKERDFLVNRDAQFEISHSTMFAIPALMSPHYYDTAMAPLLASIDLNDYTSTIVSIRKLNTTNARKYNELVFAFNAKGYQVNTVSNFLGTYFYPTTDNFYFQGKKGRQKDLADLKNIDAAMKLQDMLEFLIKYTAIPGAIFYPITFITHNFVDKKLEFVKINPSGIDKNLIYGNIYQGGNTWYIDALAEVFAESEPQITILHEGLTHNPFFLSEDGSLINRTETEGQNPYNYPPQHRFAREVLLRYIDLIITADPGAIIVVQADHGLHHEDNRKQLLAMPGGNAETVRLMQNQTMSAVRIPEKWGGLDAPLDPLNITRELVNRYVGPNYELLDSHP